MELSSQLGVENMGTVFNSATLSNTSESKGGAGSWELGCVLEEGHKLCDHGHWVLYFGGAWL